MQTQIQKYLFIGAGALLLILIVVTIVISSLLKSGTSSTPEPTLIPTTAFESSGQSGGNNSTLDPASEHRVFIQDSLSSDSAILSKLPIRNPDFEIAYSTALGEFFIQKKSDQADAQLQQFMKDNGLYDLYNTRPDLFNFTDQPVDQAIQKAEQQYGQQQIQNDQNQNQNNGGSNNGGSVNNSSGESQNQSSNQVLSPQQTSNDGTTNKDAQSFVNFVQSAMNLDFSDEITIQPIEGVQGPGNGGSGGGNGGGGSSGGGGGGGNGKLSDVVTWAKNVTDRLERGYGGAFDKLLNPPSNGAYKAIYAPSTSSASRYWCTYLVIDSYNLAGLKGLSLAQASVASLHIWWDQAPSPYKFIDYNSSNGKSSLPQVQPGCAMIMERESKKHDGYEHVDIVQSISFDSHFNGKITTLDSDTGAAKGYTFPINNGVIIPWSSINYPIRGFGCIK